MKLKRRRKANKQILLTQLFLVLLLFIGIGYSILNTNLGIDGTIQLSKKPVGTLKKQNDREENITFGKEIARASFESIEVVDHMNIPEDAIDSWDASEEQNKSVKAWYTDIDNNGLYELYIGGYGGVYANPDSNYAFQQFTSAKTINVEKLDTSKVEKMDYMFGGNSTNLTSIDISNFDTTNVTTMAGLFNKCQKLTEIKGLENLDTKNVTTMQNLFNYCSSLTNLDISNFDTKNVTSMIGMFGQCNSLIEIKGLENLDTSNVTTMWNMFTACVNLEEIDLSNWSTPNLTIMNNMFGMWNDNGSFRLDSKLKRIILSDKFDTSKVTNMYGVFANNTQIEDYSFLQYIDTSSATKLVPELVAAPLNIF